MAQQTIVQSANATLSANGTSTATGSITWTVPSLPEGIANWDSVIISGSWSWSGKGTINGVKINGVNTSVGTNFNINLPLNATSPLSITTSGNKNATGANFSWNNLVVTYTYTTADGKKIMLKVDGIWKKMNKVYVKQNGIWVEQTDLSNVFDVNKSYINANNVS